jgi:hypothetical protein
VVFQLEGQALIKANSAVLVARSEYFRIMFNKDYRFSECSSPRDKSLKLLNQNFEPHSNPALKIKIRGIPRQYFASIIQYLYTDQLIPLKDGKTDCNANFFLRMMVFADYFMLERLSDLCQHHLA